MKIGFVPFESVQSAFVRGKFESLHLVMAIQQSWSEFAERLRAPASESARSVFVSAAFGLARLASPSSGRLQFLKFRAAFLDSYFAQAVEEYKGADRPVDTLY